MLIPGTAHETAPVTDIAYEALGPLTEPDAEHDYHLLKFISALVDRLAEVEALARDRDGRPGWADLLDPTRAPVNALGYTAQFVGVDLLVGLDEAGQRIRIQESAGLNRGSIKAINGAARQTLTGSRQVLIFERTSGSAYHFTVRTYAAETPNPALTEAVLREQKPAGLILVYEVATGATYAELDAGYADYAATDAAFTDYEAMTLWIP